ncbi:MAG: site-specific integrase [Flavobacteriaceae bacterium]|nr:site-specific integrase [Flavobacteriaceae bacterium]
MKQKNFTIRFVIRKARQNEKGICPIYCRVTYLNKRNQFSTGEFVSPKDWNSKTQRVLGDTAKALYINAQLAVISNKLKMKFLELQLSNLEFGAFDFFNSYGRDFEGTNETYIIKYFKDFLTKIKKLIGKDIQWATWNKYENSCRHVESFIKSKYKKNDLPLKELKLQFLHDLEFHLKTKANLNQTTCNKVIQRFRKPIRTAVSEGILDKDPFMLYKTKHVKKRVVFLNAEELRLLEDFKFVQPRLELVKDLFVFSCYTGLPYGELMELEKKHIVINFDGELWIVMKRKKTEKKLSIPLLPKALKLIEKYQGSSEMIFPRFSNQKINSYLKEIAFIVGIEKRITHHTARKTFASTVLLYNDVPMEIVSRLLGHSSLKITESYYGKIVDKTVSQQIIKLKKELKKIKD